MDFKKYITENRYVLMDGAMGTYFSKISNSRSSLSENANIDNSKIIKKIHNEYIEAGAKLIRSNTFSANSFVLNADKNRLEKIITNGINIAKECANNSDIYYGVSIGPIPESKSVNYEQINEEYKFIIDTILKTDAHIFIFETFNSLDNVKEITEYIKKKKDKSIIMVNFSVLPNGYTRKGIKGRKILEEASKIKGIDIVGLNCGVGPVHMKKFLKEFGEKNIRNSYLAALPNAGFPEIQNERTVYPQNPNYFAEIIDDISNLGVKFLGGCCGTTPKHIAEINEKLSNEEISSVKAQVNIKKKKIFNQKLENRFKDKLEKEDFTIAVEIDPPHSTNLENMEQASKILKDCGMVDIITIADSPLGKPRLNSIMTAALIKRKFGIDTMPHICCRDRNEIALKSDILSAYIENIRNALIVTGDPVPVQFREDINSVFNFNSFSLMNLVDEMNQDHFSNDFLYFGGALNLNAINKKVEKRRMTTKSEKGAEFFLTQPIYSNETIESFITIKRETKLKILAGIMPLVSYRNARFLNNEVPGIDIPKKYMKMFDNNMNREDAEKVGIKISVEIASKLRDFADGFYFITPFNRAKMIVKIIDLTVEK